MQYLDIVRLYKHQHHLENWVPLSIPEEANILTAACPALRYMGRPSAAEFYEMEPDELDQETLKLYIRTQFEYDAVDIARIMKELESVQQLKAGRASD